MNPSVGKVTGITGSKASNYVSRKNRYIISKPVKQHASAIDLNSQVSTDSLAYQPIVANDAQRLI